MNATQTVFVVFFAIFWGVIGSVQGRWLAFQPILLYGHIARRWILSFVVLNALPTAYFVVAFIHLRGGTNIEQSDNLTTARELIAAVLAAFAMFGFYRLWMSIVQSTPTTFYQSRAGQPSHLKDIDPTIEDLRLHHKLGGWNLLSAVIYFALAGLGLCLH
jgi:hypothetical protein